MPHPSGGTTRIGAWPSRNMLFPDFPARMQPGNLLGGQRRARCFFTDQLPEVGKLKAGRAHYRRSGNLRSRRRVQTRIDRGFVPGQKFVPDVR